MNTIKSEIIKNLCYTDLVYNRINKKLNTDFSKTEIEKMIFEVIKNTEIKDIEKIGKNFYLSNPLKNIKITINPNTFRVITVNKI